MPRLCTERGAGGPSSQSRSSSRRCHGGAKAVPRRCQGGAKAVPRRCHGGAKAVPRRCHGGAKAVPLPRNPGRTAHADGRSTNTAENRRVGRGAMKDQRQQPNGGKLLAGLSQHFLSQASLRSGWCCASRSGVGAHEARES